MSILHVLNPAGPMRGPALTASLVAALPATAVAADDGAAYLPAVVVAALLIHTGLLVRLATGPGVGTCYRISYVSIYLLATVITWLLAFLTRELAAIALPSLAMLLLPVAVGLLLMARGPHRLGGSCAMSGPGVPGSKPGSAPR
ncbi:MAG: hypothetical protein U5S82_11240 [Gammaproteobacteria bacterium]|nr:hypothetical protein [Gammaproteobacteria bacterium]